MTFFRIFLASLVVCLTQFAHAQTRTDSCPSGFDRSNADDGELYLRANPDAPLNKTNALASDSFEPISIQRDIAKLYFYFIKRNANHQSGAIAVKRVYSVANSSSAGDEVVLTNNQQLDGKEVIRGLNEFTAYHQKPYGSDNRFRQDFHFKYYKINDRTDDRQDKVTSLQFDTAQLGPSKINKAMLLRYKGLRPDGTCISFNLFSKQASGLLTQTRDFLIEIQELDGASDTAVPRVRLKIILI